MRPKNRLRNRRRRRSRRPTSANRRDREPGCSGRVPAPWPGLQHESQLQVLAVADRGVDPAHLLDDGSEQGVEGSVAAHRKVAARVPATDDAAAYAASRRRSSRTQSAIAALVAASMGSSTNASGTANNCRRVGGEASLMKYSRPEPAEHESSLPRRVCEKSSRRSSRRRSTTTRRRRASARRSRCTTRRRWSRPRWSPSRPRRWRAEAPDRIAALTGT